MSAISITAASVAPSTGAVTENGVAGETITAGMVVYLKGSTNRWMKAKCNGTAEEAGSGVKLGIALSDSVNGRGIFVQTAGIISIGGTAVVATVYVAGTTYGAINPQSDLVNPNPLVLVGVGATSSTLDLILRYMGYVTP